MKIFFAGSILILMFCVGSSAQSNQTVPCPTISVTGPASLTQPEETATFTANINDENWNKYNYSWKVTGGTLVEGQNTPVIRVLTTPEMTESILNVTVEIKELPENCISTASESSQVGYICILPMAVDQYEKISFKEERGRLANVASVLMKQPDMVALFIIRVTKTEKYQSIKRRVNNISNYLSVNLKIPKERLSFVFSEGESEETIIYVSPKGGIVSLSQDTESLEKLKLNNNSSAKTSNK